MKCKKIEAVLTEPFIESLYEDVKENISVNVYKNGKRTRVRMYPISFDDTANPNRVADGHSPKSYHDIHGTESLEESLFGYNESKNADFFKWVKKSFDNVLTAIQLRYVRAVLDGREREYTKDQRSHFRKRMQTRLKRAYLGKGAEEMSVYTMGEYRRILNILFDLIQLGENNEDFTAEVIRLIDTEYMLSVVYDRVSPETRAEVIKRYNNKSYVLSIKSLGELYEIFLSDLEHHNERGLR